MVMDPFEKQIASAFSERAELMAGLGGAVKQDLTTLTTALIDCLQRGGRVFACGNGGSATQAQHFAGELVGRFKIDRPALPAFCLTDNSAALTSIANDYEFTEVFSRQIDSMAEAGDCLLVLSTSGQSENVVRACRTARGKGLRVLALTGGSGGAVAAESHATVCVPDSDTARIQELHLVLIHLMCGAVEAAVFSADDSRTK